jgi:hypothetical protein
MAQNELVATFGCSNRRTIRRHRRLLFRVERSLLPKQLEFGLGGGRRSEAFRVSYFKKTAIHSSIGRHNRRI